MNYNHYNQEMAKALSTQVLTIRYEDASTQSAIAVGRSEAYEAKCKANAYADELNLRGLEIERPIWLTR